MIACACKAVCDTAADSVALSADAAAAVVVTDVGGFFRRASNLSASKDEYVEENDISVGKIEHRRVQTRYWYNFPGRSGGYVI